jgi:hypothetical protein
MHKKLTAPSFVFNILLGAFMFVFGEADDSPGAQLLGLIAVVIGVVGLITLLRSKHTSNSSSEIG